ncbi:MAG TPA: hypothetical protein DHV03_02395 [Alphaproteobacteria bacterium]|nr:hypothetical protein [Paracoccaceae bacterium]HCY47508.1 hypothetical protein [Alphaproteobacteria bacterium]
MKHYLAALAFAWAVQATDAVALEPKELEQALRALLQEKPEIVIDAIQTFQDRLEAEQAKTSQAALTDAMNQLAKMDLPSVGATDPNAPTIYEFFDYRCGYCKKAVGHAAELTKDGVARFVFLDWPILSPQSRAAAKISLAAYRVEGSNYLELHQNLLDNRGDYSDSNLDELLEDSGYDVAVVRARLQKDDAEIEQILQTIDGIALKMGVRGTPAFIVTPKTGLASLVPGYVDVGQLRNAIPN